MSASEKFGISSLLMILAVVVAAFFTNAGKYMEVLKFDLVDARPGERVMLDYDREIKRDFNAAWKLDLYAGGVYIATASSPTAHTYRTTAVLPAPEKLDLDWLSWGHASFANLTCGDYEAVVQWSINPDSLLMRRTVEARDRFKVVCDAD